MARHESDFQADAAEPLGADALLELLGAAGHPDLQARQRAIACYLSGGDGWREAMKQLGGAFAELERGLRERKPG